MDNQTKTQPKQASQPKSIYLLAYNGICLVLWSIVTLRAIILIPALSSHGRLYGIYDALFNLLRATQTIALLEVVHAAIGLVRASPVTTAMQVASRIMLVWGVLTPYPEIIATKNVLGRTLEGTTSGPVALAGCHLAWGITEMIRYGFFVWKEGVSDTIPSWLMWLRYNTFFVLYPIGISSEVVLMYLAIQPAQDGQTGYDWLLKAVLAIYVPGSYILYTHMMAQRRKIMKGKAKASWAQNAKLCEDDTIENVSQQYKDTFDNWWTRELIVSMLTHFQIDTVVSQMSETIQHRLLVHWSLRPLT